MDWEAVEAADLFQACVENRDPRAWDEFVRRFGLLIARTVYRSVQRWTAPTQEVVDDLVQNVYLKLCAQDGRALRTFQSLHPGAEFGFLKVLAANAVADHFRTRKARPEGGSTVPLDRAPEPTQEHGGDRELMLREIEEGLDRVTQGATRERDRNVFLLYYRQGFSARAISALPTVGLSCEGVESLLGRLTKGVREYLSAGTSRREAEPS